MKHGALILTISAMTLFCGICYDIQIYGTSVAFGTLAGLLLIYAPLIVDEL